MSYSVSVCLGSCVGSEEEKTWTIKGTVFTSKELIVYQPRDINTGNQYSQAVQNEDCMRGENKLGAIWTGIKRSLGVLGHAAHVVAL